MDVPPNEGDRAGESAQRTVLETVDAGIVIVNPDNQVIEFVNPTAARMFGAAVENLTGRVCPEILRAGETGAGPMPDDGTQEERAERVIVRPDGTRVSVLRTVRLIDWWGKPRFIETIIDVSERKRAEASLQELAQVSAAASDYIVLIGVDYRYRFANDVYLRARRLRPDDIVGRHMIEVVGRQMFEELGRPQVDAALRGELVESLEWTDLGRGEPHYLHVRVTPFRETDGTISGVVMTGRDISDFTRAEEALRSSEALYHDLVETSQDLIWQCDAEGRYTYLNPAWEAAFGYRLEEMLGRSFTDFQWPEQAQRDLDAFGHLLAGGSLKGHETIHVRKDETEIHLVFNAKAVLGPDGRVGGTRGTAYDITERKRAEAERERLREQLTQAQKMESVGRLAGGVAHDFNNMLGVILGHTEMALDRIGSDAPLYADLEEIQKAAERSADLTRQLLAFARKQTVAPRVLDLNETVQGMLKMLGRLIGEDITLTWMPGSSLRPVFVDPSQVDQILANLCVNARDAIGGPGTITIETGNVCFDTAYCVGHAGFAPGEHVLLAVSDDGCGVDAGTLTHLFEPFFTTKGVGKGTGLGLATVYGIVKQNNGFIDVRSQPGRGTTFRIYLPRHEAERAQRVEQEPVQTSASGGGTILLVEDEPAMLNITAAMLERMGYAVIAAGTPGEAIRLAREHRGHIDLVVTDVVMPEMNGRDLAKNLMTLYPDISRLFMSGYTADVIAHHGVLDEGVHFIQKPFTTKTLAARISDVLARRNGAAFV
jgi:PAS domain S-box-containing protein